MNKSSYVQKLNLLLIIFFLTINFTACSSSVEPELNSTTTMRL